MAAYTDYLLIIEFSGLSILLVVWLRSLRKQTMSAHGDAPYRGSNSPQPQTKRRERFFRRATATRRLMAPKANLLKDHVHSKGASVDVPIPWGWPHYQDYRGTRMEKPTLSGSMHSLLDCLVREKQLASESLSDARITNSVRALLEDRYGRVDKSSTPAPMIQNESASAVKRLQSARIPRVYFQDMGVKVLKRPWGW